MSPILMRPVREQLEHDRVIRLLQAKWRRRYLVGINPGNEQTSAIGPSTAPLYPDLVFWSNEGGHRVEGVVEVETAESVNNMEALAEWAPFGRLRAPFYLYIPNGSVDNARRLIADNGIAVAEIWSFYLVGDQMRFTLVYKAPVKVAKPPVVKKAAATRPAPRRAAAPRTRTGSAASRKSTGTRRPAKATAAAARKRQRPAKKVAASRSQKRK